MKIILSIILIINYIVLPQSYKSIVRGNEIPDDLPIPLVTFSNNPSNGYIFASVPYWGNGNNYLVIYNNYGKPVYFKKTKTLCTDFKLNSNGLYSYFDYYTKKFYAMDSTMTVIDSFWVKNGYETDEHDIKFLNNGNVILIGLEHKIVNMSEIIKGGYNNASVITNVIQELDKNKNIVFEWKSSEHYKYTDAGEQVNLLDQAFVHTHINSIDVDTDNNIIISARNLNEITKIDRRNGEIIWRFGGKNNQFLFIGDTTKFNAQHSVKVLANGNILIYDNASYNLGINSRAVEYKLNPINKTASVVWEYSNREPIKSLFWGNAQRLENGNTFIAWGLNDIAATEVNSDGQKVFEMKFPKDVYSYRIFKFPYNPITTVNNTNYVPTEFTILQNYPNPFNSITTIKLSINKPNFVQLKIYDSIGNEITTLVNKFLETGLYNYPFSTNYYNLTSGVYFYKLQIGSHFFVKKMILLR